MQCFVEQVIYSFSSSENQISSVFKVLLGLVLFFKKLFFSISRQNCFFQFRLLIFSIELRSKQGNIVPRSALFVTVDYNPNPVFTTQASVNPAQKTVFQKIARFITCTLKRTSSRRNDALQSSPKSNYRQEIVHESSGDDEDTTEDPINSDDDGCAESSEKLSEKLSPKLSLPKAVCETSVLSVSFK